MAFAPSFGSVGDFLSITILIKDIALALDECRGSAHKYQQLRQGLDVLGETIRHVENAYQNPELVVSNDASTTATRLISQIHQSLADFKSQKLQKYATSLSPGGSGNAFKDAARKIQFKFDEKDIESFQREVMTNNMLLTILLEVSAMHTIKRNNDETVKQVSAIASQNQELQNETKRNSSYLISFGRSVFAKLNFLSHSVADIHNSITQVLSLVFSISTGVAELRSLIMKIEWPLSDEHFVLEDATCRPFPIHLKTVTSWAVFEHILQEKFKGRTGAHRVLRGRYMLTERATSIEVERSRTWENAFRPYQKVDMSIMCRVAATETDVDKSTTCPVCGTQSTSEMDAQVKCQNCNTFYRRITNLDEDENDLMDAPMSPHQRQHSHSGKWSSSPTTPGHSWGKRQQKRGSDNETEGRYEGKAVDEAESESDEEDYRGLSRIAFVSRRKRMEVSAEALAALLATDTNGINIADHALGDPQVTSPRQSEQNRPTSGENDDGGPRYDSSRIDLTSSSATHDLFTEENGHDKTIETNKATSSELDKSKSERDRQSSDMYYRRHASDNSEDTDEYVEVNGITYVIPARSRSKRRLDRYADVASSRRYAGYYESHETPHLDRYTYAASSRRYSGPYERYESPRPDKASRPTQTAKSSATTSSGKRKATEADAKKYRIPPGYSLKHWEPDEEPILLLGSVFDANSLGKWIYDWTVYTHGPSTPTSEMAGELWLLLIQLAGKVKRSKDATPRIQPIEVREMVEDFTESGDRITDKLRKLLKTCEKPMLKAAKRKEQLGRNSGTEFVETIFGKERELEKTERFMRQARLWNLRFDANCGDILKGLESEAPSNELQSTSQI